MILRLLFVAFALAVSVHADLTCLEWGLLLTPLGLWCHFKHDSFNAAENASVAAAESMATEVKDAAVFTVKHHPLVLEYDYVETAIENGTAAANSQLRGQLHDEVKVGIGMGKELANTAVNIYELAHWDDLTFCLMDSAQRAALYPQDQVGNVTNSNSGRPIQVGTAKAKRATPLSGSQAEAILSRCATQKFRRLARPAVFNITDPNERIGSTLTQLAGFFVPVGSEAEGAELALNGLDLAIPGSEDAGRIYQQVGEEARHFESEADALAVKKQLDDPSWVKDNCNSCSAPIKSSIAKTKRDIRKARLAAPLKPRGNIMSLCCKMPQLPTGKITNTQRPVPGIEELVPDSDEAPFPFPPVPIQIPESALSAAPNLAMWGDVVRDATGVLDDLAQYDTAVLAWSHDAVETISSKELFRLLRRAFEPVTDADHALAEELNINIPSGSLRLWSSTTDWPRGYSKNADMAKIQDFTETAFDQIFQAVQEYRGLSAAEMRGLEYSMDIYYIPPSKLALNNPDPRGLHVDYNTLQFGAADQPGLIIDHDGKLFRVPIVDNGWHLIKCSKWAKKGSKTVEGNRVTSHTVFGPEIVEKGRVSIIVNVL